jgi:hypothetical protein
MNNNSEWKFLESPTLLAQPKTGGGGEGFLTMSEKETKLLIKKP